MPRTSIITPLYNAENTISETIESVLKQTDCDWEMLVVDNNSTDKGPQIVKRYAAQDSRIKLLVQHDEPGAGQTRNVGIQSAQGRFIAFLDADDTWDASKLKTQVTRMLADDLAFSWTSYRVNTGKGTFPVRQATPMATANDLLAKRAVIGCLTTIYDTQRLGKVYMTDIKKRQDFVLFVTLLRLAEQQNQKVAGLNHVLATYRLQHNSLSSSKSSAARYQWKALREYCHLSLPKALWFFASYTVRGITDRLKLMKG